RSHRSLDRVHAAGTARPERGAARTATGAAWSILRARRLGRCGLRAGARRGAIRGPRRRVRFGPPRWPGVAVASDILSIRRSRQRPPVVRRRGEARAIFRGAPSAVLGVSVFAPMVGGLGERTADG